VTAEGGRSTITGVDVESVMSPDGQFAVELTIDQGRRWSKPKPIYLAKREARQLARQLMEATGFTPHVVLDEEEMKLRKELADPATTYEDRRDTEVALAVCDLVRRMWLTEATHD
jgi:hypothetical protein